MNKNMIGHMAAMVSILYESQGGSTKRYAMAFATKIGCSCYSLKNAGEVISDGSDVVFFGWRSGPIIVGYADAKSRYNVIGTVVVGLEQYKEKDIRKMMKKNSVDTLFYVRGAMDRSKLVGNQKLILGLVNIMMLLFRHSPEDRHTREIMNKGGDLSSEDQLDPALEWYASLNVPADR